MPTGSVPSWTSKAGRGAGGVSSSGGNGSGSGSGQSGTKEVGPIRWRCICAAFKPPPDEGHPSAVPAMATDTEVEKGAAPVPSSNCKQKPNRDWKWLDAPRATTVDASWLVPAAPQPAVLVEDGSWSWSAEAAGAEVSASAASAAASAAAPAPAPLIIDCFIIWLLSNKIYFINFNSTRQLVYNEATRCIVATCTEILCIHVVAISAISASTTSSPTSALSQPITASREKPCQHHQCTKSIRLRQI